MARKYSRGMGWYNENERHRLARMGVKTGRKVNYATDVTIQPTTFGVPPPKEEQVMKDADAILAEAQQQVTYEPETALDVEEEGEEESAFKESSKLSKEIEEDISALESGEESLNVLQKTWSDKLKERIKSSAQSALQAYKDLNVNGIEQHIGNLDVERTQLEDHISLLNNLKGKVMSQGYRDEVGVSNQLKQVSRVNKLLQEPTSALNTINNTIAKLERRKQILLQQGHGKDKKKGIVSETYTSIFPTFGEIMHPERLRQSKKPVHHKPKPKPVHHRPSARRRVLYAPPLPYYPYYR